ncbi:MAG: type pantothenate kinase [Candidatus Midichloriaceae bacterium]|jgi:type III pantothenate kinase|nr:type pantothenate kinase [Candidatus Midichloriaceae bacterium]
MYLCLDVGNTQIHGGVFEDKKLIMDFRLNTKQPWSSDQLGLFIRNILKEHGITEFEKIAAIGVSSVVSSLDHHIKNACLKYFSKLPIFIDYTSKIGINLDKFEHPNEIGADLLASAFCALHDHPNENLIIVDMGTATTIVAITKDRAFLGGVIAPGLLTQVKSLAESAEKLFITNIEKPKTYLGTTTNQAMQSGVFFGQLGALKYLIKNIIQESFPNESSIVIGTGGFSKLYKAEDVFDVLASDLVLRGIMCFLCG